MLAREWQALLAEPGCSSRADLARRLGVTRARVTQVLQLLDLAPAVVDALAALGEALPRPVLTERRLRALLGQSAQAQQHLLRHITAGAAGG